MIEVGHLAAKTIQAVSNAQNTKTHKHGKHSKNL
jgi:hypothetical protein